MKRALLGLGLVACQGAPKSQPAELASASASAATAPASASAAAAPMPWFSGRWQGSYDAELHRIETAAGGVKEWKQDDGKQAAGPGTLSLEAKPDGSVSGSASGPLGEQNLLGHIEGDRVALTLTSSAENGFRGVIVAAQVGSDIKGVLSASTGDSLSVRRASVTLSKVAR
ncbi:MAG TPA: hypothetical protein VIW29_19880 [Polyangiaceae bacterium]